MAGTDGGLAENLESLADLTRGIPRGEDPLLRYAHVPEDSLEIEAAIVDAHGGDDVLLHLKHFFRNLGYVDGKNVLGVFHLCRQ